MARSKTSPARRALLQTDRAFWCIHDHLDVLAYLALPTLAAVLATSLALVYVWRTWELPDGVDVLLLAWAVPFLSLCFFTVLPLPCAVFAWTAAEGAPASAGACFAWCRRKSWRLTIVLFRCGFAYLVSMVLFWLPLAWFVPRNCLAPMVALFEKDRHMFRRAKKLMREDYSVAMIGALYLAMGLVLGFLIVTPRILVATPALGAHLLDAPWRVAVLDYLWIYETASGAILLSGISVVWWISLTLIYHDVRQIREGEDLKRRIAAYRAGVSA